MQFLKIARSGWRQKVEDFKKEDLPKIVQDHVDGVKREASLMLLADVDSMVEILSNLIRNATEAEPKGDVLVTASRDGGLIRVQVNDDGQEFPVMRCSTSTTPATPIAASWAIQSTPTAPSPSCRKI